MLIGLLPTDVICLKLVSTYVSCAVLFVGCVGWVGPYPLPVGLCILLGLNCLGVELKSMVFGRTALTPLFFAACFVEGGGCIQLLNLTFFQFQESISESGLSI